MATAYSQSAGSHGENLAAPPVDRMQLVAEQVALIYRQVAVVLIGVLVNAAVLTYALWSVVSHGRLLVWLGANVAVCGLRVVLAWRYRRAGQLPAAAVRWRNYYVVGILATGVLWGSAGLWLFPQQSIVHQVFLVFLAGGLSAGSVAAYAAIPWLAAGFFVPTLVPLTLRFFLQGNETSTIMGTMLLVFAVLIGVLSRNMNAISVTYLRLRLENAGLVGYLTRAKQSAETLNAELTTEIRERNQAEQALRASEEKFRSLVENATDAILLTVGQQVRYANRAAFDLLGYGEAELLGMAPSAYMADTPLGETLIRRRLAEQEAGGPDAIQFEAQLRRADGTLIDVIYSSSKVHLGDEPGLITLVKDITERKQAEMELRRAKDKAEEATLLKDQFVSLVAHDLKSPLTSIFGMIQILDEDTERPLSPSQKEVLHVIMRGGETLLRTIDDLLNISRLQTGKIKPAPKFIDGYAVTDGAVSILVHLASEKGVALVNAVPPHTRLYADPELMGKVVQNLVSNAIKFCRREDKITVFVPEGRPTTLAVKDTGIGISAAKVPDLFSPESMMTTPGTAGERGTGLGLILSLDIMRAHGGELTVESEEGEGSVFYATLPEVRPHVLLVGSSELFRQLLRHQLEGINAVFLQARDAGEALAVLQRETVHLLITETDLPGKNGYELLRQIRSGALSLTLPVIMIMDSGPSEAVEQAFRLGADDTIVKPLVPYDFIARLRRFVH